MVILETIENTNEQNYKIYNSDSEIITANILLYFLSEFFPYIFYTYVNV